MNSPEIIFPKQNCLEPILNWRGSSKTCKRTEQFLKKYTPGERKKIKQYWSTSKTLGYNESAAIKIYVQDSGKGRDISSIGLDESEVLYERDMEIDVISKVFQDCVWHILVKEV